MRDSRDHSALKGLSVTYLALLGALVFFIVLMGIIFTVLERQDQQNGIYFKLVGEQRFLSRSLVTEAGEAARGKEVAFARLKEGRDRFEQALNDQKSGNATLGLSPSPPAVRPQLDQLENRWKLIETDIDTLLAGREPVMAVSNFVPLLESSLTQIITLSDEIAKSLANNRIDSRQVYLATYQLRLGQQIESDLKRMLAEGGTGVAAAADRFGRNVNLFGRVLRGMRDGDSRLGVDRVSLPDSAGKLADLAERFKSLEAETARIADRAPELVKVQNAVQSISEKGDALLEATTKLLDVYSENSHQFHLLGIPLNYTIAYLFGILALILLLVLIYLQNRESRQRLLESEQRKQDRKSVV